MAELNWEAVEGASEGQQPFVPRRGGALTPCRATANGFILNTMRPLTPFSGGLFQLAFTTAGAVGIVAAGLMLADRPGGFMGLTTVTRGSTLSYDVAPGDGGRLSAPDRHFVTRAAALNGDASKLAGLAAARAANGSVKIFMVEVAARRQRNREDLASIAAQHRLLLNADGGGSRAERRLAVTAPAALDRDFVRELHNTHDDELLLYENAARDCENADLREFARRTLADLQIHAAQGMRLKQHLP